MTSANWSARSRGRRQGGAVTSLCLGLVLGLSLGYGVLRLTEVAAVRGFACAKLSALSHALSCYD